MADYIAAAWPLMNFNFRVRKTTLFLAAITVTGFLLRLAGVLSFRPMPNSDPAVYVHAAELLLRGPAAFRHSWYMLWPNGYSGLLGLFASLFGARTIPYLVIAGINLTFGTLEIVMIFRVVAWLTRRRAWGLGAAILTAINPFFILYASSAFTETLCSSLSTLLIYLLIRVFASGGRRFYPLAAFALMAAVAFNYNARMIGFLLLPPLLFFTRMNRQKAASAVAILAGFYVAVAAPKIFIIHQQEGKWPLGSLVGGVNLYIGNSTYANGRYFVRETDPVWREFVKKRADHPYKANLMLLKTARKNIARNPQQFLQRIPQRLKALLASDKPPLSTPAFVHTEWIDRYLPTVSTQAELYPKILNSAYPRVFKKLFATLGLIAAAVMITAIARELMRCGWLALKRMQTLAFFLFVPAVLLLNVVTVMAMFGDTRFFYIFYSQLVILIFSAPIFCRELRNRNVTRYRLPLACSSPAGLHCTIFIMVAGWIWFVLRLIS